MREGAGSVAIASVQAAADRNPTAQPLGSIDRGCRRTLQLDRTAARVLAFARGGTLRGRRHLAGWLAKLHPTIGQRRCRGAGQAATPRLDAADNNQSENRSMSPQRRHVLAALSAVLVSAIVPSVPVPAQDFPAHPVRLVVPFAAGGSTDVVARIIAAEMSKFLGQQVVVDNKPGGGGSIGSAEVARSAPDGHTVLAATVSTHAINPSLYATLPFDAAKDFQAVAHLVNVPNVLVAHPSVPATTVAELREHAHANPGQLNYASPGNGSIGHLQSHWFGQLIDAEMTHVPYRGAGPALQDLIAGRVQLMVDNVPTSLGHIKSGALRAILVSSERRIPQLPDVPSSPEAGVPTFIGYSWVALLVPKGTPRPAVDALQQASAKALADPQVRERLNELSATVVAGGPEAATAFLESERAKWAPIVKATGVTLD